MQLRPCDVCGAQFEPVRKSHRFCSGNCRQAATRQRRGPKPPRSVAGQVCAGCGQTFEGRKRKYCSKSCYPVQASKRAPCLECGKDTWTNHGQAVRCLDCRRARPTSQKPNAECAMCSKRFVSRKRSDGRWSRCCSISCAKRLEVVEGKHIWSDRAYNDPELRRQNRRRRTERRRKRLYEVVADRYTRQEIFERDGFKCGICGLKVPMDRAWPHPKSPSIDHVVPLAAGGDDTMANVQLAHLSCNTSKRDRGTQQLRLIG